MLKLDSVHFSATFWVDSHEEAVEAAAFAFDAYFGEGNYEWGYAEAAYNNTDKFGTYEVNVMAWGKEQE
jgi:hypothetical protein